MKTYVVKKQMSQDAHYDGSKVVCPAVTLGYAYSTSEAKELIEADKKSHLEGIDPKQYRDSHLKGYGMFQIESAPAVSPSWWVLWQYEVF